MSIVICQRKHAISLLFSNDPDLLEFFFMGDRFSARWRNSFDVAAYSSMLKRERAILVRAAVDIWESSGFVRLFEVFEGLSPDRSECLMLALDVLVNNRGCQCINCSLRLNYVFERGSKDYVDPF